MNIAGTKASAKRRVAPLKNGVCVRLALRIVAPSETRKATTAAAIHVTTQFQLSGVRSVATVATNATPPAAAIPQPEIAVTGSARSIVSRMYCRLSIARSCSAGGWADGAVVIGRMVATGGI